MKNNLIHHIIFIFVFFVLQNNAFSNDVIFDTFEIDILNNGNTIKAKDGTAKINQGKILIKAKKFNYNKKTKSIEIPLNP